MTILLENNNRGASLSGGNVGSALIMKLASLSDYNSLDPESKKVLGLGTRLKYEAQNKIRGLRESASKRIAPKSGSAARNITPAGIGTTGAISGGSVSPAGPTALATTSKTKPISGSVSAAGSGPMKVPGGVSAAGVNTPKSPGRLSSLANRAKPFLNKHKKAIGVGAGSLAVGAGAMHLMNKRRQRRQEQQESQQRR